MFPCRVCLHVGDPSDLFQPCNCKGNSANIHRACLELVRTTTPNPVAARNCIECRAAYVLVPARMNPFRWLAFAWAVFPRVASFVFRGCGLWALYRASDGMIAGLLANGYRDSYVLLAMVVLFNACAVTAYACHLLVASRSLTFHAEFVKHVEAPAWVVVGRSAGG